MLCKNAPVLHRASYPCLKPGRLTLCACTLTGDYDVEIDLHRMDGEEVQSPVPCSMCERLHV